MHLRMHFVTKAKSQEYKEDIILNMRRPSLKQIQQQITAISFHIKQIIQLEEDNKYKEVVQEFKQS